jgi:hypothetical protein
VFIKAQANCKLLYLVLFESSLIRPDNYKKENHSAFKKVFTWDADLVDKIKYFKITIPQNPSPEIKTPKSLDRKFATLIASNKKSHLPGELYSKRVEAIEYFELHHQESFDLYGNSWDKDVYSGFFKFLNLLNRLPWKMPFRLQPHYSVFKGRVESKLIVLCQYKFSICFENFCNSNGYITEKIFDCFYAGCVPVYWGAPDVKDYIPANCFIDMRDFNSYEELYRFLNSMPDKEFVQYQKNISNFLEGDAYKVFLPDAFADILLNNL